MQADIRLIRHNSNEYRDFVALRYQVLRKPLGLQFSDEQLAKEKDDYLIAAYISHELAGTMILTPAENKDIKMRQVAVNDAMQGKGIGKAMVAFAEDLAVKEGFARMVLHARKTAVPFYLSLGYKVDGEEFEEVSIPHLAMEKVL